MIFFFSIKSYNSAIDARNSMMLKSVVGGNGQSLCSSLVLFYSLVACLID